MFRAVHGSTVFYPSDAISTERLDRNDGAPPGINYIRTSRPKTAILYSKDEKFPVPGFKVPRKSAQDRVTVIGAGITVHEALKAADELKSQGTAIRVIDLYCVKPIDGKALAAEIAGTGGRLVTVEDHWPEGGVGEAVLGALAQAGFGAREIPTCSRCATCRTPVSRTSWWTRSEFPRGTSPRPSAKSPSKVQARVAERSGASRDPVSRRTSALRAHILRPMG